MPGLAGFTTGHLDADEVRRAAQRLAALVTRPGLNRLEGPVIEGGVAALQVHNGILAGRYPARGGARSVWLDGELFDRRPERTDAEELLARWLEAGDSWDFLAGLDGVFAAALVDEVAGKVHLVGDRLGMRILFWGVVDGRLGWSSQLGGFLALPGFRPEIDRDGVPEFFTAGHLVGERTWFRGVAARARRHRAQLRPAHGRACAAAVLVVGPDPAAAGARGPAGGGPRGGPPPAGLGRCPLTAGRPCRRLAQRGPRLSRDLRRRARRAPAAGAHLRAARLRRRAHRRPGRRPAPERARRRAHHGAELARRQGRGRLVDGRTLQPHEPARHRGRAGVPPAARHQPRRLRRRPDPRRRLSGRRRPPRPVRRGRRRAQAAGRA